MHDSCGYDVFRLAVVNLDMRPEWRCAARRADRRQSPKTCVLASALEVYLAMRLD